MRKRLLVVAASLALAACGFHLRGQEQVELPFKSMYIQGNPNAIVVAELRHVIKATGATTLTDTPSQAQAVLAVLGETQNEAILSLSGAGRVAEYRLNYSVTFELLGNKKKMLIPPTEVALQQDIAYNDSELLAKQSEEVGLYQQMQRDAARQILRRVRAAHLAESR